MDIWVHCLGSPSPYSSVDSEVYDYMNDASEPYDERHEEHNKVPRLLTAPQQLTVNTGDTVRLPCLVDRLEGFVMLWKKKDNILTVAEQIIDKVGTEKLLTHLLNDIKEKSLYVCILCCYVRCADSLIISKP